MDIEKQIEEEAKQLLNDPEMRPFVGHVQENVDNDEEYELAENLIETYMDNPELDPEDGIEDLIDDE